MKEIIIFRWSALLAAVCLLAASPAYSTYVQKQFVVRNDLGQDVLCDPYIVKEKDSVLKVFREKGEIAIKDLSYFMEMFKRINPDIQDINLIYTNQRILIPLKIIEPGSLEGQETGVVSIPMITITNIPLKIQGKSTQYVVAEGDCISKLLARQFGDVQSRSYKEGMEIFKYLNPDIKDPNKLVVGQKINLPMASIRDESWYPQLFDESGKLVVTEEAAAKAKPVTEEKIAAKAKPAPGALEKIEPLEMPKPLEIAELPEISELPEILDSTNLPQKAKKSESQFDKEKLTAPEIEKQMPMPEPKKPAHALGVATPPASAPTIFKKAATILDAQLLDSGQYFFPREGTSDLKLDLSVTPIMEMGSGQKVLLAQAKDLETTDQDVVQSYWKEIAIVKIDENQEINDLLTILCPIAHKRGCENKISFNDQGVSVHVQGQYIFEDMDVNGKTCVTLIDIEDQKTPNSFRLYLESNMVKLSEWINGGSYFGPVQHYAADAPLQPITTVTGISSQDFVRRFAQAMGFKYEEQVEVEFSYAGFQRKILSNLLSAAAGREVLVDFGDIKGDALQSSQTTGFKIIEISPQQDSMAIVKNLMDGLSIRYKDDPAFWAAERPRIYNSSVQVPGLLIEYASGPQNLGTLISLAPIQTNLLSFFNQSGIGVIRLIQ